MNEITYNDLPNVIRQIYLSVIDIENRLKNLSLLQKENNEFLSVQEASKFLGITTSSLYTMVSRREIPYCKPTKRLYFHRQELEKWILKSAVKTFEQFEIKSKKYD